MEKQKVKVGMEHFKINVMQNGIHAEELLLNYVTIADQHKRQN